MYTKSNNDNAALFGIESYNLPPTTRQTVFQMIMFERMGALWSQARAEIEQRGNYLIKSFKDQKLEMGHETWETGNRKWDLGY